MQWANAQCRQLAEAAIAGSASPAATLPPGEYEIRFGLEGCADGMRFQAGVLGRLIVRPKNRPYHELIELALAIVMQKVPAAARAKLIKDLVKLTAAADPDQVPQLSAARKILRRLVPKTGVEWRETPTYKPRD
jgi:hypothetical protein